MSIEYPCVHYDHEKCTLHGSDPEHIDWCVLGPCSKETPSNADHIRSMTDEELAECINRTKEPCSCCELTETDGACTETLCDNAMLRWLKQPYKEDT